MLATEFAPPAAVAQWIWSLGGASVLFLGLHKVYVILRGDTVSPEKFAALEQRVTVMEQRHEHQQRAQAEANEARMEKILSAIQRRK